MDNKIVELDNYWIEGRAVLKEMTDNDKYLYEVLWRNNDEDSGEYFFGILVTEEPITELKKQPTVFITLNKEVVDSLVKNDELEILDKAKELDAEVLGKDYSQESSYRGDEPWATINDAIEIAKKEIESGKEIKDVVKLMHDNAIDKYNATHGSGIKF